MLPTADRTCADCTPSYVRRSLENVAASTIFLSSLPLALTWLVVALIAQRRLFPSLAGGVEGKSAYDDLPVFNNNSFQPAARPTWRARLGRPSSRKLAQWVFSSTMGLSAVLVELLLCEISNTLDPAARGLGLRVTLSALLVFIVIVAPALVIHGITKGIVSTPSDTSTKRGRPKLRLTLSCALLAMWLLVFWYIPQASLLRTTLHDSEQAYSDIDSAFIQACLERIGIIGISLMASLAGFAAVSSLWQTFGVRTRLVKESDITRKTAGLSATEDMLSTKQSRMRALERKLSEGGGTQDQAGLFGRVMGSLRGSNEAQELKALRMEISGLETMRFTLSSSLSTLQNRHTEQERAKTKLGRLLNFANLIFAVYCAYRIFATSLSSLRRWWNPSHSFATSDPINNVLALLTTHYDSDLNREAWSRQFSFLLSGIMLMASFNAVLQTFRLFARFAPGLLQHAQTSLPLIISQIAGTYVVSSALLLRSNLPAEVSSVITEALGAPLEGRFVEGWFESWFLVAVGLTATGVLVGRKVSGSDEDWDDDGSIEMGKQS